jgi:hypothetical protein
MESIAEVKQALQARSKTATLEDLRSQGRQRIRVIQADEIAAMIRHAVEEAVAGAVDPGQVESLVKRSREEFASKLATREQELARARETAGELAQTRADLEIALKRVSELEELVAAGATGAVATGGSTDLVMRLMNEVATLKAAMSGPQPAAPAGGDATTIAAALDKLAGSLNDRLEKFGRKIGVSSAVEGDAVKFDALFKHDEETKLESNIDSVQIKQKAGGGIGSNLDRLRKLKGGG